MIKSGVRTETGMLEPFASAMLTARLPPPSPSALRGNERLLA